MVVLFPDKVGGRKRFYIDHVRMFRAIESGPVPTRYDLRVEEIRAIDYVCGGASRCFPEYAFSVAGMYFDYGFVKGVRWGSRETRVTPMSEMPSSDMCCFMPWDLEVGLS